MNKCQGLMGLIFGHNFQPKYTTEITGARWPFTEGTIESQIASTTTQNIPNIINATGSNKQTYHYDVCCRCGMMVEKETGEILKRKYNENEKTKISKSNNA